MLQRQATVRRLRKQLYQAQLDASEALVRANIMSLTALPEVSQFRDLLAMEYRRASHSGDQFAVILLDLPDLSDEKLGQTAQLVHMMLRPHEALFRVAPRRLGIILPAIRFADATAFAAHLGDNIRRTLPGEQVAESVIAYPEQAGSLMELEGRLRAAVS
jgi:GGDEF domain-containing protein